MWLIAVIGVTLVAGAYLVWGGLMAFVNANGSITNQATVQAAIATQTQAQIVVDLATQVPIPTQTPTRPCQDFKVSAQIAIVRDCAKLTCPTRQAKLPAGALVCVYGVAPASTSWYEINLRPTGLFPDIAYMSRDILYPLNPTTYPTRTFTPLPTVTPTTAPRLSATPAPASPILPTVTPAARSAKPFAVTGGTSQS